MFECFIYNIFLALTFLTENWKDSSAEILSDFFLVTRYANLLHTLLLKQNKRKNITWFDRYILLCSFGICIATFVVYIIIKELPNDMKAVEYTDCFSAKRQDPHPTNECPGYDTKQYDGEVPVMENAEYSFIAITPRSTLARSSSTW